MYDLTGRFPVKSYDGYEYIMVVRHHGYIHLVPLKNRTSLAYVSAYKSVVSFFSSLSHPLTHLLLDNETSSALTDYFVSISLTFQYAPPKTIALSRRNGQSKPPKTTSSPSSLLVTSPFPPTAGPTYSPNPNSPLTPFFPGPPILPSPPIMVFTPVPLISPLIPSTLPAS